MLPACVRAFLDSNLDLITNDDTVNAFCRKLAPSLITLSQSRQPEIQYVALRNISLIVQKRPNLLGQKIKVRPPAVCVPRECRRSIVWSAFACTRFTNTGHRSLTSVAYRFPAHADTPVVAKALHTSKSVLDFRLPPCAPVCI